MSSGNSNVVPSNVSQKTYKNAVAKQRQLKRLRKMKTKDRQDDIDMSDVSAIEFMQAEEEPQENWLNELINEDTPTTTDSCGAQTFLDKIVEFSLSNKEAVGIGIGALLLVAVFNSRR